MLAAFVALRVWSMCRSWQRKLPDPERGYAIMMIREFVDRTGFEPTATEYAAIEEKYYSFDGSKDEFARHGLRTEESSD